MRYFLSFVLVLIIHHIDSSVYGISFEVLSTETRCVYDEVSRGSLVSGSYSVTNNKANGASRVKVYVTSPDQEELFASHGGDMEPHHKSQVGETEASSKFAFVAGASPTASGKYQVCFKNEDVVSHIVTLKLKSGVEAKDLSEVAQRDHLRPLALELLRLEEYVQEVRDEMLRMKAWEAEMRDMNEVTNSRVRLFSLFSVFIVLTLGISQVFYLRNYLMSKKII